MSAEPKTPYLSVIIPCWNEQKNLEQGALDEVHRHLAAQPYPWEVVVVNDGSTDDSRNLVRRFIEGKAGFFLLDIPHGGKLAAIREGLQKARGETVLFTDMDQSTPITELDKLLRWIRQGFEVVIGSRGKAREGSSLLRKAGSAVFSAIRRLVLLPGIADTQCGFKLCRREAALKIFPRIQMVPRAPKPGAWKVSAYDVEFLYLCQRAGYRIKEIEVAWRNRDQSDTKGLRGEAARYLAESADMAREVCRVILNQIRRRY